MKNIGIFGIGAIGSLITKYISTNQANRYFYFNRSQKELVTVKYLNQFERIPINLSTYSDQKLDWLIICLKEYQSKSALFQLKSLISENTKVAIFQNGVDISSPYLRYATTNHILETIMDCSVQLGDSNVYTQFKDPIITLPDATIADDFIELFPNSVIQFIKTKKFKEAQWIKLIESSSIGSVQALTKQPCSIFQQSKYRDTFIDLVREGAKVAESEGVILNKDVEKQLLQKLLSYPEHKGSSMLTDVLAGKEQELDAKIGAIVKSANRNGVDVPISKRIYEMLQDG